MRLYHYSVNSYRGDAFLKNDYNNQYEFAEPYLSALEKGRSVFDAVFYATMYMGREVRV